MKRRLGLFAAMTLSTAAYAGEHAGKAAEHGGKAAPSGKAAILSPATATWTAMGDNKGGPWLSIIQGDMKTGPFTAYAKFKAGWESGWHTHNANFSAVLIEGTVWQAEQGNEGTTYSSAGQAWATTAGTNHSDKCVGKKDCVIFLSMGGAMSFNPMTADGKPAPAPAAKTN